MSFLAQMVVLHVFCVEVNWGLIVYCLMHVFSVSSSVVQVFLSIDGWSGWMPQVAQAYKLLLSNSEWQEFPVGGNSQQMCHMISSCKHPVRRPKNSSPPLRSLVLMLINMIASQYCLNDKLEKTFLKLADKLLQLTLPSIRHLSISAVIFQFISTGLVNKKTAKF